MVDHVQSAARSRRVDILEAARREFAAAGFAGARIERIAASAAVNKQLLFHYFDSKEGLFTAAVGQLLEQLESRPAVSGGNAPVGQVRALLRELVAAMRAVPGLAGMVADARANPEFPRPAARLLAQWRERLLNRLVAAIESGQRQGFFRDDADPRAVAAVALAAAVGVVAVDGGAGDAPFEDFLATLLVEHCAWR